MCVCVCEREREREGGGERACVCACVCLCAIVKYFAFVSERFLAPCLIELLMFHCKMY